MTHGPFLIEFAVDAIREGEGVGGELLLRHLILAREKGLPVSKDVIDILFESFEKILDGEDPAKALHLAKRKGAPREPVSTKSDREEWIYALVRKCLDAGDTLEVAIENVSADLGPGYSESKVKRAYLSEKKRQPWPVGPEVKTFGIEKGLPYFAEQDGVPESALRLVYDYAVKTGRLSHPKNSGSPLLEALGRKQK